MQFPHRERLDEDIHFVFLDRFACGRHIVLRWSNHSDLGHTGLVLPRIRFIFRHPGNDGHFVADQIEFVDYHLIGGDVLVRLGPAQTNAGSVKENEGVDEIGEGHGIRFSVGGNCRRQSEQ